MVFWDLFFNCIKISIQMKLLPFHLLFPFSFFSTLSVLILEWCSKSLSWTTLSGQASSYVSYLTHHEFTCRGHFLIASASPMDCQRNYAENCLGFFSFKHLSWDITHAVIECLHWMQSHWVNFWKFLSCSCQNYFKFYICTSFLAADKTLKESCDELARFF